MCYYVIMWYPKVPNSQVLSCFLGLHLLEPAPALVGSAFNPRRAGIFETRRLLELEFFTRKCCSMARMERWCRSVGKGLGGHRGHLAITRLHKMCSCEIRYFLHILAECQWQTIWHEGQLLCITAEHLLDVFPYSNQQHLCGGTYSLSIWACADAYFKLLCMWSFHICSKMLQTDAVDALHIFTVEANHCAVYLQQCAKVCTQ